MIHVTCECDTFLLSTVSYPDTSSSDGESRLIEKFSLSHNVHMKSNTCWILAIQKSVNSLEVNEPASK